MESLHLKAKSRQEVAEEYDICVKTLFRWFKKANLKIPLGLIDPFHLKVIYETFGVPKSPKKS